MHERVDIYLSDDLLACLPYLPAYFRRRKENHRVACFFMCIWRSMRLRLHSRLHLHPHSWGMGIELGRIGMNWDELG